MKNKHLVLLFLGVLIAGFLSRRIPWPVKKMFQTNLIELDTAGVTQISIFQPNQPELLLERIETGWAAAQENRSAAVRPEKITPILEALSAIRFIRIVKTTRPDTLGFSENARLRVAIFQKKELLEQFEIGYETIESGQPSTLIHLNRHEGIYLVENHLRAIFSKTLADFRENTVARFESADVRAIRLEKPDGEQIFFQKNDSAGLWESSSRPPVPNDSLQMWLQLFSLLNASPFADNFDESRARETFFSGIKCYYLNGDSLIFSVFYVRPPDVPEEILATKLGGLPVYVLHSSQNPSNYFAPTDTLLLWQICSGPIPPEKPATTMKNDRDE